MKRYDGIAFAGALGALAGLSVAVVNAWEILPTILSAVVCMVVAGVAYRPLEIFIVVVNACRALPGVLRSTPQWFGARKEQLQKGFRTTLFVTECITLGVLSLLAIPVLLYVCGVLPFPGSAIGLDIVYIGILSAGVGVFTFFYILMTYGETSPHWAFRMGKAFHRIVDLENDEEKTAQKDSAQKKRDILLSFLCCPILLELMSLGIIIIALDVLSTLLLALASTERIAAVLGGVLGWGTAVLLHALGIPGDLFLLAIGGAVGWFAGPLLYRLRAYLSRVPAVETVQ